jgi:predicted amidohydrolase YtcJ
MCVACDWAKHWPIQHFNRTVSPGDFPSRRRVLQAGAAFGVAAIAPILEASEVFPQAAQPGDAKADIIFRNGPVYTINGGQAWARAVAVQVKHIAYVGDDAGVQRFVGPQTRIVDLRGKMLLPGFVEGHTHPVIGSTITRGIDLQYDTRGDTLKALEAYRAKIGKVDVVRGFGWRYSAFPPTGARKEDLDRIWPDTAVILLAIDGHSAWVNSKTLIVAGVTKETKDAVPGFSYFQRDPVTGEATGWLVEVPVIAQVMAAVAPFSSDYIAQSLEQWLPQASAAGITSVFDAGLVLVPDEMGFQLYMDLERREKLPFRVVGTYYHKDPAVDPLPLIRALRQRFSSELVQASVLKLNMDGGEAQYTAAMLAPYSDKPNTSGETLLSADLVKDIVRRVDGEGIDVHVHCIGDRATRLTLDAIEAAIASNPPRDRRHAICHLSAVDDADLPRFAKLRVTAQFSAQWAVPDQYWSKVVKPRYGKRRSARTLRVGSILRHGANISLGTDWPAATYYSTFRPLEAVQVAVTRQELGKPRQTPLPPSGERISLDEALRANTIGAAYQAGLDKKVGSIEAGKLADLIVLDRNIFEIPPQDIHKTKVAMTVMNGKVRHEGSI